MKHGADRARGTAAVELALVLPLLLTLVLGAIDWGFYFTIREIAIHAAREGAREGSLVGKTSGDGLAAANGFLTNAGFCTGGASDDGSDAATVRVKVACGPPDGPDGSFVVLTNFFPAALVPRTLTVRAQIRHE
jgi:hypothetical protein